MKKADIFLEQEIQWFKRVLNFRMLQSYDRSEWPVTAQKLPADELELLVKANVISDIEPPELSNDNSAYSWVVKTYQLSGWERVVLILALLPHIAPSVLDVLSEEKSARYGGMKGVQHKGFIPTVETALFILSESDIGLRFELSAMFEEQHKFRKANILTVETVPKGEPETAGVLTVSREILDIIIRGNVRLPDFGNDFPAKRITTEMSWEDLVLAPITQRQVEEVKMWMRQRDKLLNELKMSKRVKPGFKILFHGSPGTGKTLTACLLGQYTEQHVFRIDLSMVVSKYIGETEKNLSKIFDRADNSGWILFFDEADALFGSRTKVSSSHDRYANQEVSYLLQRIEDYNGIVILASNMKGNIDDAFMRRFNSVVHFPFPKTEERQILWKKSLPEQLLLSPDVDLKRIADRYEMSGANITNIIAWCALMALDKGDMQVTDQMLREGVARELAKEGRTI